VTFNVQVFSLGFNSNSLSAKIGQPVTVNVSNTAGVPHTFSIDGVTGADTGTIGPGTTKSITFTPTAEGSLTFYCKIHGANAMKGTLTVTP
jgi:plastocyanin